MIREFTDGDAPAVAAIQRLLEPDVVVTEASLRHRLAREPERARLRFCVAEKCGEVVGWARARLNWEVERGDDGSFQLGVQPGARGRGHGGALFEAATGHLVAVGATRMRTVAVDTDGERFLERHGFSRGRSEGVFALDPRAVELPEPTVPDGFCVVPLREVIRQERALHEVYVSTHADIPADEPETNIGFEEWLDECLRSPVLDLDGSFVVLDVDLPVALTFLFTERERGVAEHDMTGTLSGYRRRGLARAVKLAALRWAAANGFQLVSTANDGENVGMQRLNEGLGFRRLATRWEYRTAPSLA